MALRGTELEFILVLDKHFNPNNSQKCMKRNRMVLLLLFLNDNDTSPNLGGTHSTQHTGKFLGE